MKSWLWPDRTIGKREARALREEHNRLVDSASQMRAALHSIAGVTANENSDTDVMADALGEIQGIIRRTLEATKEGA